MTKKPKTSKDAADKVVKNIRSKARERVVLLTLHVFPMGHSNLPEMLS